MSRPKLDASKLPSAVLEVTRHLGAHGFRAWLVGGCVRDSVLWQLRGAAPPGSWVAKDWDLATDAHPKTVMRLFRRAIPTGIEHGTVTVMVGKTPLEVTTLRTEGGYADGRRPESILFVTDVEEDLSRRDFTINALAFDPQAEELVDPFRGLSDLKEGLIRAVGNPIQRFSEDGLRVLRAARFVATLGFQIHPETAAAMRPCLGTYSQVSSERVRDEWVKALGAAEPSRAFRAMAAHGLLDHTASGLAALAAGDARSWSHCLSSVDRCSRDHLELRLAALLGALEPSASAAARGADTLLRELRFSNAQRVQVRHLIALQPVPPPDASPASIRRYLSQVTPECLPHAVSLAKARAATLPQVQQDIDTFTQRAAALLAQDPPLTLRQLAVGGNRLLKAGFPRGRELGQTLAYLLEQVLEVPEFNTEAKLLELAQARLAANRAAH